MTSTVQTGDSLEIKIFQLFSAWIDNGCFFATSDCCKVFRRKGYFSRDRNKPIVFDVSIELFLPGSSDYSMVWLIECKNYKSAVPVDDAEEFFSKLQQVSGANIKGVIASNNAFQESTVNFCRSKGIGLLRFFDEKQFKWILNRTNLAQPDAADSGQIYLALTNEAYRTKTSSIYCHIGDVYTNSAARFFAALAVGFVSDRDFQRVKPPPRSEQAVVDFVSKEEIEKVSTMVLASIDYSHGAVDLEEICDEQSSQSGLKLTLDVDATADDVRAGVLGRISFDPLEIVIYRQSQMNSGRQRFTLAHELGHLLLGHDRYLRAEYCEARDFEIDDSMSADDLRRLEWQANYFAACLLLPRDSLAREFLRLIRMFGIRDRGHGKLFVDEQPCNMEAYYSITNQLKLNLMVSRLALKLRLEDLGLLTDVRNTRKLGGSLSSIESLTAHNPRIAR